MGLDNSNNETINLPEGWEAKTYGVAFDFLSTASYSRSKTTEDGSLGYIHYGDIHTKWNHKLDLNTQSLPFIDESLLGTYSLLQEGDLVMADASEDYEGVGKSIEVKNVNQKRIISGLHTFLLRDKSENFSNGFKGYIHVMPFVKEQLNRLATGLKVYGVSKYNLKRIVIPTPPIEEQKAIAKVLSDMDALIHSLEQQIEKKRQILQGAMRELFLPKPDWSEHKLGEVCKITMGQSPSSIYYNQNQIGLPLVQGNADIKNRRTIIRNYTSQASKVCEPEDTIMTVRAPVGEVAKASFKACLGRGVCAINYSNDFLYHYFIFIEPRWSSHSTGSTFDSINSDTLKNIKLFMPDEKEQLKIASILTDISNEITELEIKHEKTASLKKGLMSDLLTGKTRLV